MFSVPPPPPAFFVPPPRFSVPPPPTFKPPTFKPLTFTPPPPPMFKPPAVTPMPAEPEPGSSGDTGEEDRKDPVVNPEPNYAPPPPPPPPPPKVKVAPIDTILFDDDAVPKEIIADLLFESIGGQEILTIARHDTVNGQTVLYQPIKNINILQQQYNPNNLLKLRDTSDTVFGNFTINLDNKIPQVGTGPNGASIYLDDASGDLVIDLVNLANDELVEVQITSSGTIYEAG
jgi:hypothetical protein